MGDSGRAQAGPTRGVHVAAGRDLYDEQRGLGLNTVQFKAAPEDGSLFAVEMTCHRRGGPVRHLHPDQDEWFYILAGEFVIEVGEERFSLHPGDALLAPRTVPHAWACLSEAGGRFLATLTPARQAEAFFREMGKANEQVVDPVVLRAYGFELVGPPLALESPA